MKKIAFISILLFLFLNKASLFSQSKVIIGQYVTNIGAQLIEQSNIDDVHKTEFESTFKLKKRALNAENEFTLQFIPLEGYKILVDSNIIQAIKNKKRLKFIIDFYTKNEAIPTKIDTLITALNLKIHGVTKYVEINTIESSTIKIINKCSKIDSFRFEQVNIVGNDLPDKSEIIIYDCDTIYYPVKINSTPPGAQIFIEDVHFADAKFTPFLYDKNIKPSLIIKLSKQGYEPYSDIIDDLKPGTINHWSAYLKKKKTRAYKEALIFGSSVLAYALIYYSIQTNIKAAPPKIPSPADFPK